MNCHRARQLISPYLDQQLTGREMLDLQEHFTECDSCAAEARSLRQVKSLLRSLHSQRPGGGFSETVLARLAEPVSPPRRDLLPPRPQRGRRLTTALAFSCFAVLVMAAPFAPASHDEAAAPMRFSSGFFSASPHLAPAMTVLTSFPGTATLSAASVSDLRPDGFGTLTENDEVQRERAFAARYVHLSPSDLSPAPLADDTVRGYVQSDIVLAGSRR